MKKIRIKYDWEENCIRITTNAKVYKYPFIIHPNTHKLKSEVLNIGWCNKIEFLYEGAYAHSQLLGKKSGFDRGYKQHAIDTNDIKQGRWK